MVGSMLAGVYVERLCFAPHRKGAAAAAMVASFALWMQFEELGDAALPRHLYAFPALYEGASKLGRLGLRIEPRLLVAAILVARPVGILYRSRFGTAVRAVIDSPAAAELSGINVSASRCGSSPSPPRSAG